MRHREGAKKQTINTYNVLLLCFIGLGSMTYGYTASIIGTTLGAYCLTDTTPSARLNDS